MLLKLQKYDINLEYIRKGRKDSAPQTEPQSEFCRQLEEVSLSEHLPVSVELMQQFCDDHIASYIAIDHHSTKIGN